MKLCVLWVYRIHKLKWDKGYVCIVKVLFLLGYLKIGMLLKRETN